jgi:hypothetical protein
MCVFRGTSVVLGPRLCLEGGFWVGNESSGRQCEYVPFVVALLTVSTY